MGSYLPPDNSERAPPNPSQEGYLVLDLPNPEGWKAELTWLAGWLHTEMVYLPAYSHPSKY